MKLRAEITAKEQLSAALAISAFEYIYAPMEFVGADSISARNKHRIIAVPPVFLGRNELKIANELRKLKQAGFKSALAHTLGHIELIVSAGLIPHGGFRLNITNSSAQKQYEELGLADSIFSLELSLKSIDKIERNISVGIMAYGHMPLMLLRRCTVRDDKPCGKSSCNALTDRLGNKFQTYCRQGEIEVLNPVPLVVSEFTADFAVFRFSPGEKVRENPDCKNFTRGLYNRRVK